MTDREQQSDADFQPSTQRELGRFVSENARNAQQGLLPVGGRTSLDQARSAEPGIKKIDLSQLNRIVDYPYRDMTITAEAGIRIDELQSLLAEHKQHLPVDVPQSRRATLGGVVASNTHGPRSFGYGTLRDYVIGITAVDAGGRLFHSGGRVVKNVAGYDLCKLMIGSRGTLAIISQITLKLRPLPESSRILWTALPAFSDIDIVLECLTASRTRPIALEVLNSVAAQQIAQETGTELFSNSPILAVGVEGSVQETEWQLATLREEIGPFGPLSMKNIDAQQTAVVWNALTDFPTRCDSPLSFRIDLRPSQTMPLMEQVDQHDIAVITHAGNGSIVGQLPEEGAAAEPYHGLMDSIKNQLTARGGQLTILNCDRHWSDLQPIAGGTPAAWQLMHGLKRNLDPHSLLNPERHPHTAAPA